MQYKLLDKDDIHLMKDVLEDDDMKFDKQNLDNFIDTKDAYGFAAKNDDKIIGFAYGYALLRPDGDKMFYLHSIGLLPQYQNQGIGTKLMQFIIEFASGKGYRELFVITDKGNPRACHLYEKVGGKNDYENEIVYVCDFRKLGV